MLAVPRVSRGTSRPRSNPRPTPDAVGKETPFVTPRSIDVYIRRLREKIERDPRQPQYLKTLRGIGYRFEAPK